MTTYTKILTFSYLVFPVKEALLFRNGAPGTLQCFPSRAQQRDELVWPASCSPLLYTLQKLVVYSLIRSQPY